MVCSTGKSGLSRLIKLLLPVTWWFNWDHCNRPLGCHSLERQFSEENDWIAGKVLVPCLLKNVQKYDGEHTCAVRAKECSHIRLSGERLVYDSKIEY